MFHVKHCWEFDVICMAYCKKIAHKIFGDWATHRPDRGVRGSAFLMVLIGVVVFAALTYAITRGGESAKNLSDEKTRLLATEMLDLGGRMTETVAQLTLHGVADTELSFENNGRMVNAGCSTSACKIFDSEGGAMDPEPPPPQANNGEEWVYTGDVAVPDIGTDAADLVMILPDLPLGLCRRINMLSGIGDESTAPPTLPAIVLSPFAGAYDPTPASLTDAAFHAKKSGCFYAKLSGAAVPTVPANTEIYNFFYVLKAR